MKTQLSRLVIPTLLSLTPLAAQVPYFSDFEADGGGFVGTNDWQRGIPTGVVGSTISGGYGFAEPTGGHSGSYCWGTVIGGLHGRSVTSSLSQTFDFSGSVGTRMSFQEWIESGSNAFDTAKVFANGTEVYFSDGNSATQWRLVSIDLSAYDGNAAVTIDFVFATTTVVERVGWYLDDIAIGFSPTTFGTGCGAAAVPTMGFEGVPVDKTTLTIRVDNAPASSSASLLFGFSNTLWSGIGLPLDLGLIGFPGCSLLVTPDVALPTLTDSGGSASFDVAVSSGGLSGLTIYWQWFVIVPAQPMPLYTSDGLQTLIQ